MTLNFPFFKLLFPWVQLRIYNIRVFSLIQMPRLLVSVAKFVILGHLTFVQILKKVALNFNVLTT